MGGEAMLWFIVSGVLAGYLSARMAYCWESGTLAHIAVGIIGAYMGTTVFRLVGITSDSALGMIVIGALGASCALWLLRVIYEHSDF